MAIAFFKYPQVGLQLRSSFFGELNHPWIYYLGQSAKSNLLAWQQVARSTGNASQKVAPQLDGLPQGRDPKPTALAGLTKHRMLTMHNTFGLYISGMPIPLVSHSIR